MESAVARPSRFALRLFMQHAREVFGARNSPAQQLAARLCAKEAVIKALRLQSSPWQEMEVRADQDGGPTVHLTGSLAAHDGAVAISLSHSDSMAGAVAVVCA